MNQSADVKRSYESPLRKAQAAATRRAIIDAASVLFIERGYVASVGAVPLAQVLRDVGGIVRSVGIHEHNDVGLRELQA